MTLVDLTHAVADGMQTYPGDPPVSIRPAATMGDDGVRVSALSLGSHAGTHVDAPAHTEPDGATLGAFDVSAFRFAARLVDVTGLADRTAIRPAVLPDLDDAGDVDCLVFHTGWDAHWGADRYLDHPYLAPETARWCADRGFAVGLDALSPDPTPPDVGDVAGDAGGDSGDTHPDDALAAHHALLGADCLLLENLTDLGSLPDRFTLHAPPLALDGDGAPVRAVAEF